MTSLESTKMNLSPALALGGGIGLVAAGALATALVMRGPAAVETPAAASKATAAAAGNGTAPKTATPATRSTGGSTGGSTGATVASRGTEAPPLATRPAADAAPVCANCGVVQSVTAVTKKGEGTGIGAVAGGVIGGVVGNQMGGGSGKDAMTVIGAVGGGIAGHEIEKRQRSTTEYQIRVRMADGTLRTVTQARSLPVGQTVEVNGNQLIAVDAPAAREPQPRLQQAGARS
jgi:outer membrane lipoprotein SlyB